MAGNVAGDLPAAGGVPDVHGLLQVQGLDERGEVVGVGVHVVAVPGLARAAVAAAVVRDHPEAVLAQEEHLGVPRVRGQRPAVAEDNGLPRAPVLVVDLRAVSGRDPVTGGGVGA
jgi:hypothetical protein